MLAILTVVTTTILVLALCMWSLIVAYKEQDMQLAKASIKLFKGMLVADLIYFLLVIIIGVMPYN